MDDITNGKSNKPKGKAKTREEAIAAGIKVRDVIHSMKRRRPWHNYNLKGTYMLTMVVDGREPLFGTLVANTSDTETQQPARVELTELGKVIRDEELQKINHFYPMVEVWKLCVMPDHLHMIVRVKSDMPEGKHLGDVIAGFKSGCNRAWWHLLGLPTEGPKKGLFESGYNDKILLRDGQLNCWKSYLDDNPRRLWLKRQNPQLFTVLTDREVEGHRCQMIGNRFLLDIPDKVAVIVHRRYTTEERARLRVEWLSCGERGGVIVSAAISPEEKSVLREAMELGYPIILLRENGFPPLYKPAGEGFNACLEGRMLQICPWEYHIEKRTITRAQCQELNALAERIAEVR